MIKPPDTSYHKDKYCSYCGCLFSEQKDYPRRCFHCGNDTWLNPKPVVVAIVPVYVSRIARYQPTFLIQQRANEPCIGGWCFPGGHIEVGESWQQAAVRELQEEVGLTTKPEDFNLVEVRTAPDANNILIFASHCGVYADEIQFQPNDEVWAIDLPTLPEDKELCFPTHNEVWRRFYYSVDWS